MPDLLVLKNPNACVVDSVAYLDEQMQEYSEETKKKAAKLIKQQMKQMGTNKDYLKDFPQPKLPKIESSHIQAEIQRVLQEKEAENGQMAVDDLEKSYKDVEEPDKNNVQAWEKALETAKVNN